jgi:hypothetical protein
MKKPPPRKPKSKKAPKPPQAKASHKTPAVERAPGTWHKIVSLVKSAVGRKPHAAPTKTKRAPR